MDFGHLNPLETQIETRTRLDSAMTDRAYAELAESVTAPGSFLQAAADDVERTDHAARVCLRYYGVQPGTVPAETTDECERLDYLCRPSGTMRREVRLEADWYRRAFGAVLARLDTGEPVALLPSGLGGYSFTDPVTGKRVRVNRRTAARLRTKAELFYRPLPPRPLGIRDLMAYALSMFDMGDYLLVVGTGLIAALVGLLPAWVNSVVFGLVIPSNQQSLIAPLAALLLGVAITTVLIQACHNLVVERVAIKTQFMSEAALFARMLSLPTSFFKEYSGGELGQRVSQTSLLIQQVISIALGTGLSIVLSLTYVVQIALYVRSLALPAFAIVFLQLAATIASIVVGSRYEARSSETLAKLSGTVNALLCGVQKIKLAGAEDRAFAKWAHGYAKYAKIEYNRPAFVRALPVLGTIIGTIGTVVLYVIAGTTGTNVTEYMSFNVAYGQLLGGVGMLMGLSGQAAQLGPMYRMVKPILQAMPELSEDKPAVGSLTGAIEVSGVSFRYGLDEPFVLRDLSLSVRPGEYIALVGASGCGKSTLMRLLLGFETPERGMITFGPHDASKVDIGSLRRHIGVVTQNGKLFMGDILSNITIASPSSTIDDAWAAAELAGIADDIRKMPMGMQTMMTEGGGGISGGQRQRIMIARAICGNKRIVMFDEATSALDNKAQKHVIDSLEKLNCTRLVVAHRLSTVRHCDRILVLDGGTIAEQGTYEELIARGGLFADLVARQRLEEEG